MQKDFDNKVTYRMFRNSDVIMFCDHIATKIYHNIDFLTLNLNFEAYHSCICRIILIAFNGTHIKIVAQKLTDLIDFKLLFPKNFVLNLNISLL